MFCSPSLLVSWGVILLGIVAGNGCAAEAHRAVLAAPRAPTLSELKNTAYSGFDVVKTPITLKDGRWEGAPYVADGASRPTISFVGDFYRTGDLGADGSEAVVLLAEHAGGSGEYVYLAAVARPAGQVRNVGTVRLGDRVQIRAVRIEGRGVIVDLVRAGPQDAACCPGELVTRRWQLRPDGLQETQAASPPGRLTLETIGGSEWVLRAWNLNDSAPAEPNVTLAVKDGKFVGVSGCNRYFAAVKLGAMPGDVTVGAVGATRMACSEERKAIESRFLKQLAEVKKFGFMVGQLALSYEAAGVWGVMLFDAHQPSGRK
jgi:heat shock protein HslJ